MIIDERLAERRKSVAEDRAKRNMGRLLKFLVAVVAVGSLVWLAFSPWLSVRQVDATGIEVSAGYTILADAGVVAGTPMIQVSVSGTEAALLEDPWIAEASVDKTWPDLVTVTVVERVPLAWARTEGGWTRRALDGAALPSASEPGDGWAHIDMPDLADVAAVTAPDMLGALEFIDALPNRLRPGTVVSSRDGELWATVAGFQVRLGREVEMREKATSLQALLENPLAEGSVITLIAPTHPSVKEPGAGQGQIGSEDDGVAAETDDGNDDVADETDE